MKTDSKKKDALNIDQSDAPNLLHGPISWNHSETLVRGIDRDGELGVGPDRLHGGINWNHSETLVRA